ncbi:MAG: tRNA (guanine(46)-N(7))-methyltransferase TrmB, partial [Christensenellaceae bacterium]
MRMRRKRNLDERILACGEYVIKAEIRDRNMQRAVLEKEYLPLSEIFGNEHPVVLEIGSGKGLFACELARRHPEWNVLALEMISNVVIVGAERAKAEGIPNVRFFISRAECVEKYLPPHSVARLYLNFSTPLPKDGYAKQRLTHERFLRRYASVLTEDGVIEQKTDNVPFFEFSLAQYEACG